MTAPVVEPAEIDTLWPLPRTSRQSRAWACLRRRGIDDLRWLVRWSPRELLELRGFGVACLAEVHLSLAARGVALTDDEGEPA